MHTLSDLTAQYRRQCAAIMKARPGGSAERLVEQVQAARLLHAQIVQRGGTPDALPSLATYRAPRDPVWTCPWCGGADEDHACCRALFGGGDDEAGE